MRYEVYRFVDLAKADEIVRGFNADFQIWRPAINRPWPPDLGPRFLLWTFAHWTRLFRNRSYRVLYLMESDRITHRSCIVPSYFRWPFMKAADVQISSTWTDPECRGRGLATLGLAKAVTSMATEDRNIWYTTRDNNPASIATCLKVGSTLYGYAGRTKVLGSRLLGRLQIYEIVDTSALQDGESMA